VPLYRASAQHRVAIDHESGVGEARRLAQELARALQMDEVQVGRVAIIATELGNNLWRHGGGGELLMQALGTQVELLAIDRGVGITDIGRSVVDGYSTAGTAGQGLGAIRRLSAEFDLYSLPGKGTIVMSRIGAPPPVAFGAICVPLRGETDCGDAWAFAAESEVTAACVADGLGHGTLAADASRAMIDAFAAAPTDEPQSLVQAGHRRMSGTRGAAAACCRTARGGRLLYAGVGNISGHHLNPDASQGLVSHSGILGVTVRRVQQFQYECAAGGLLVMHSDGVSARWNLADHPGLFARHPAVIAAQLFRDHGRPRDDATVLVVRQ
jgi:anti-sigma regulatory factor (Ser/Thr protein kinase)